MQISTSLKYIGALRTEPGLLQSIRYSMAPGSTELPECRCGKEMQLTRIEALPDRTDAQIRIYNCPACTMRPSGPKTYRLRVISVSSFSLGRLRRFSRNDARDAAAIL